MGIALIGSVTGPNQSGPLSSNPAEQQLAVGLQSLADTHKPVTASDFLAETAKATALIRIAEAQGTTVVSRSLSNPVGDDAEKRRNPYSGRRHRFYPEEAEASPLPPTTLVVSEVHHLDILA